jgi:hypothetical protein
VTRYGLLFALAALLSGVTVLQGINPNDEGLVLQAGARVADGQLPYRDFYANYPPGQYLFSGGLDLLFGPSLLGWRVVRVALDGLVAVLAYALARRDAPEPLALGAWLAVAAAMAYPSIPHPNAPALALALGGLLVARRSPVGGGLLAGAAVMFRIDLGAAAIASGALAAAAAGPGTEEANPAGGAPRRDGRDAGRLALTGGLVGALLLAPFVAVAPGAFWDQTLGFALDEQRLQRLPLPGAWHQGFEPNKLLEFYFPYVLLAGTALWFYVAVLRRAPLRLWAPAPLAAAGVAYLLARADVFHLVPLAAVLPVLLATAAARERRAGGTAMAFVLSVIVALIAFNGLDLKRVELLDQPPLARIDLDVADGVEAPAPEARALSSLVPYVRARVPPGRPVFVANPRYDLVKVGNPLLYVLLDRPNPTRYDVMQPGVVTTAQVQHEIVADLERARPPLVIRWLSPVADQPEPNGAGRSSGVHVLDRYLARSYGELKRFGDYEVLRRRGNGEGPAAGQPGSG